MEIFGDFATTTCFGSAAADYKEFPYNGSCTSSNSSSLFCQNETRRTCLSQGYVGSSGVIGANDKAIATMCLKPATGANSAVGFSVINQLQSQNPSVASCNRNGIIEGTGCQNNAHRFCLSRGYGTGFNISEFDGKQSGSAVCTPVGKKIPSSAFIDLRQVHIGEDLWQGGCDIWSPSSLSCRWASFNYCLRNGYAGGYGPLTTSNPTAEGYNVATVACMSSQAADYREFPYSGSCTSISPTSLYCQSEARRSCLNKGYAGSSGVIGASARAIATMCLKSGAGVDSAVSFSSVAEIQAQSPDDASCTVDGIITGGNCQLASHRFCVNHGYGTGFGVSEYNGGTQAGLVVCAQAQSVQSEVQTDPQTGRWGRPAFLGTKLMGGPVLAGNTTTYPDVIYNGYRFPILVTYAQPSVFSGMTKSDSSAGDSCFSMSGPTINAFNESYGNNSYSFAELMCSYPSKSGTIPGMNYGAFGRGVILKPGESLIYQAATNSKGSGFSSFASVTFSPVAGNTPMMRVRFPRNDQNWVGSPGMLTVPAGCTGPVCSIQPKSTISPFPNVSSNSWYVTSNHTTIQGITVYGTTDMSFTIRIVQQGGAPLAPPYHVDLSSVQSFAAGQSAFIPLNLDVPAGALVGIDFTLPVNHGPGDDFAGYLWFSRSP